MASCPVGCDLSIIFNTMVGDVALSSTAFAVCDELIADNAFYFISGTRCQTALFLA